MFGDSNGQIKLRAKQKFNFLSATEVNFVGYLIPKPFLQKNSSGTI